MKHPAKLLAFVLVLALLSCLGCAALAEDSAADIDAYLGVWEYDDYYLWFEFRADGSWAFYNDSGLISDGPYEAADGGVQMLRPDGSDFYFVSLDGDVMTDDEGDTLSAGELPDFETTNLEAFGAAGVWQRTDGLADSRIAVYPGGRWSLYDDSGFAGSGPVRLAGHTLYLLENEDDADEDAVLTLTISGILAADEDGVLYILGSLPYEYESVLNIP